jgi:hypothetical protein
MNKTPVSSSNVIAASEKHIGSTGGKPAEVTPEEELKGISKEDLGQAVGGLATVRA